MKFLTKRRYTYQFLIVAALCFFVMPFISACGGAGGISPIGIGGTGAPGAPTLQIANRNICAAPEPGLSIDQVRTIVAQAVSQATVLGRAATIAVLDREGNVLALFRMNGAPTTTRFRIDVRRRLVTDCGGAAQFQDVAGPLGGRDLPSEFAAISKAGTGAFFGTGGNAFTPRSASFIIQEHIPPGLPDIQSGPLFGVQFSSLLFSDINPRLPLGLSGDPGGIPLFINGSAVGGIGVEFDGQYIVEQCANNLERFEEEVVARGGARGFEAPTEIQGDRIVIDGASLTFTSPLTNPGPPPPLLSLDGRGTFLVPPRAGAAMLGPNSAFQCGTLRGLPVRIFRGFQGIPGLLPSAPGFPDIIGTPTDVPVNARLTRDEVEQILFQAIRQANITRAGIRRPFNSFAEVNVTVLDVNGRVLGIRGTPDAPVFGLDVSAQKGRTALLFSRPDAVAIFQQAGVGPYVDALRAFTNNQVRLDGSVAFSSRGLGELHRPFFPNGISSQGNPPGPLSTPFATNQPLTGPLGPSPAILRPGRQLREGIFSPLNVGLQLDYLAGPLEDLLAGVPNPRLPLFPARNGMQIFAGGVPLYKNGVLVGAIGISGDGIDQDDIVCGMGSAGFEAPDAIRNTQFEIRGIRLPYLKFPAQPNL
jgi:uncharacterized protein GlcG (DUF336 family)